MIRLRKASFSYSSPDVVVNNGDLEIPSGLTLLVGPNGCGKSTVLKLLAGIERPDSGSVEIAGKDLWVEEVAARRSLAFVPEQPDLTPYAAVEDVLTLVCRLRQEPVVKAREMLERVGLRSMLRRSIRELSMGQRRRVVLAAAWVGSPKVVLLDEPLESMDRVIREDILSWIDALLLQDATVVIATHEIEPFVSKAATALTVRDGRCAVHAPLPDVPEEKMRFLERLSR